MSAHFGLESYSSPKDCDDDSNVFILDKYRTKIESVKTAPEISVSGVTGTEVAATNESQDHLQRLNDLDINKSAQEDAGFGNDTGDLQEDTVDMNDITREEFNAKLETIEVKMDARVESVSVKIDAFLSAQAERDKAQLERDKRYELLADRITNAAESAADAARQAATVKSNYWAAVGVQLLAVGAILVGAYFANQGNTLMVAQTTLSAFTSGRDSIQPSEKKPSPQLQQPQPNKQPE